MLESRMQFIPGYKFLQVGHMLLLFCPLVETCQLGFNRAFGFVMTSYMFQDGGQTTSRIDLRVVVVAAVLYVGTKRNVDRSAILYNTYGKRKVASPQVATANMPVPHCTAHGTNTGCCGAVFCNLDGGCVCA
jgi:hypothetical protein